MSSRVKPKKESKVGVSIDELRKERYTVLLRGVVLGMRDVGIKDVDIGNVNTEGGRLNFTVQRKSHQDV